MSSWDEIEKSRTAGARSNLFIPQTNFDDALNMALASENPFQFNLISIIL